MGTWFQEEFIHNTRNQNTIQSELEHHEAISYVNDALIIQWFRLICLPVMAMSVHVQRELTATFERLFNCERDPQGALRWSLSPAPHSYLLTSFRFDRIFTAENSFIYNIYKYMFVCFCFLFCLFVNR